MSTLTLYLDTGNLEYSYAFNEELKDEPLKNKPVLEFKSDGLVHKGNNAVYRGRLTGFPGKLAERKVVCKIAKDSKKAMDRLRSEAEIYKTALDEIQACSVPRFFGIFSGKLDDTDAVCILLQDCGVPLNGYVQDYDEEFRIKVIQALLVIHAYGVQHNDFNERNLVVDDADNPQRVFVIDFDHATYRKCENKMKVWLYTIIPPVARFGCYEIWKTVKDYGLWTPDYVRYMGESVSWKMFKTPEELVKAGRRLSSCETQDPLTCAYDAIKEWQDMYMYRKDYITRKTSVSIEPAWPPKLYGAEMD